MPTHERVKLRFREEIRIAWWKWLRTLPREEQSRPWHGGKNFQLLYEWSGTDESGDRDYSHRLKQWLAAGPSTEDLHGEGVQLFRLFCENIGVDFDELLSEPTVERRDVFKSRLTKKLGEYKRNTGRSMKALSEHLGWSEIDYQWLRRIKANGSDHTRSRKRQLDQLAQELGTTTDYLFGMTDENPTMEVIVLLGVEEFARRQPKGSEFANQDRILRYLGIEE